MKFIKILNKNKSLINLLSRNDTSLSKTLRYYKYEKNLLKLQLEMIKLQNWVYEKNKKVIIICEGRDAALFLHDLIQYIIYRFFWIQLDTLTSTITSDSKKHIRQNWV